MISASYVYCWADCRSLYPSDSGIIHSSVHNKVDALTFRQIKSNKYKAPAVAPAAKKLRRSGKERSCSHRGYLRNGGNHSRRPTLKMTIQRAHRPLLRRGTTTAMNRRSKGTAKTLKMEKGPLVKVRRFFSLNKTTRS